MTRYLLDTNIFLWAFMEPARVPSAIATLLQTPNASQKVYLSTASAWEIVIKHSLGKLTLPLPVEEYIPSRAQMAGLATLPITQPHTLAVATLPPLHKDPFDRLLVAQAKYESMTLLTADKMLPGYGIPVIGVGA